MIIYMKYNEVNYNMHMEFLRREILKDLEEVSRYNEQFREISVSLSHIPAELRPIPLKRYNNYMKSYKHNTMFK